MKDKLEQFVKLDQEIKKELRRLDREYSLISFLRGVVFFLALILVLFGVTENLTALLICGAALFLVFVWLVKRHADSVAKRDVEKSREQAAEQYVRRFKNEWHAFSDNGSEFLEPGDVVQRDIDLLGPASLYQMIHVCHTEVGRARLAGSLKNPYFSAQERARRQEAIAELSGDALFAVNFEAALIRLTGRKKKANLKAFEAFCTSKESYRLPLWAHVIRFLFPLAFFATVILALCGVVHYLVPLGVFLGVLAFSWLAGGVANAVILPVYSISPAARDSMDVLDLIEKKEFHSEKLSELSGRVTGETGIRRAFSAIFRLCQAYNISFNPLIHQLFSGALLWDFQLAAAAGRWHEKYGANMAGCFELVADFEELLSFAVLGMVRDTREAVVEENRKIFVQGTDVRHPLLLPKDCVGNDCSLSGGITIITGSNMSGKTTFLRTLAVNLCLAYAGAPVTAETFSCTPMRVFTSMRVTDDVSQGISSFYAEILRIKSMAEYREKQLPMVCFIDEIFKGTNSADRIVGARHVIRELAGSSCMTVVSTHDFELCELSGADGVPAVNLHFEEYYEGDELKFDYKLKQGRCTTTNARAILRMAGFAVEDTDM